MLSRPDGSPGRIRLAQAQRLMNRPADARITGPIAREIAQREQLKAFVTGSIASLAP